MVIELNSITITLFCNLGQWFATSVGTTDESDDQRDDKQSYHAVGCNGEALAVLSID